MRFFFTGPRFFGIRPGISFNPNELRRFTRTQQPASPMTGGFVYVLADESGRHKIGSAIDPIARRATLQTGSPERLTFAFVGVSPEMTYPRIERAAHDLLESQRIPNGGDEWFRVPASIAIGAVYEAAQRLGAPIQQVAPEMVPHIIQLANQAVPPPLPRRRSDFWGGVAWVCFCLIGLAVFAVLSHK
jgi:hypothetical protein